MDIFNAKEMYRLFDLLSFSLSLTTFVKILHQLQFKQIN